MGEKSNDATQDQKKTIVHQGYGQQGTGYTEIIEAGTECLISMRRKDGTYEVMTLAGLIVVQLPKTWNLTGVSR